MLSEKEKLTIAETEPKFTELSINVEHKGCFLTALAKHLDQDIVAHMPTHSVKDKIIHVYCASSQSLDKSEIKTLFGKLNGNLVSAKVYTPGRSTFFDLRYEDAPISALFSTPNSSIKNYVATRERERVVMELRGESFQNVMSRINELASVEISQVRRMRPEEMSTGLLPSDEMGLLQSLVQWGFYDLPSRRITLQEAAARLNVPDSTLSLRVRSLTDKVFREYMRQSMTFRE